VTAKGKIARATMATNCDTNSKYALNTTMVCESVLTDFSGINCQANVISRCSSMFGTDADSWCTKNIGGSSAFVCHYAEIGQTCYGSGTDEAPAIACKKGDPIYKKRAVTCCNK
jgi:hypothetical protein